MPIGPKGVIGPDRVIEPKGPVGLGPVGSEGLIRSKGLLEPAVLSESSNAKGKCSSDPKSSIIVFHKTHP